MSEWREFGGVNEGYVLELYERFQKDPSSVDAATRATFERLGPPRQPDATRPNLTQPDPTRPNLTQPDPTRPNLTQPALTSIVGAVNLAESIRRYGHLAATIDPLGSAPVGDPSLQAETHGVTEAELQQLPASLVGGPLAEGAAHAAEAIGHLRRVYCSSIGYDLAQIFVPEEREWLRHH